MSTERGKGAVDRGQDTAASEELARELMGIAAQDEGGLTHRLADNPALAKLAEDLSEASEGRPGEVESQSTDRVGAIEDEALLRHAEALAGSQLSARDLAVVRAGLGERGLLAADPSEDTPRGALTRELLAAEQRAAGGVVVESARSSARSSVQPTPEGSGRTRRGKQERKVATREQRMQAAGVDLDDAARADLERQSQRRHGGEDPDVVARAVREQRVNHARGRVEAALTPQPDKQTDMAGVETRVHEALDSTKGPAAKPARGTPEWEEQVRARGREVRAQRAAARDAKPEATEQPSVTAVDPIAADHVAVISELGSRAAWRGQRRWAIDEGYVEERTRPDGKGGEEVYLAPVAGEREASGRAVVEALNQRLEVIQRGEQDLETVLKAVEQHMGSNSGAEGAQVAPATQTAEAATGSTPEPEATGATAGTVAAEAQPTAPPRAGTQPELNTPAPPVSQPEPAERPAGANSDPSVQPPQPGANPNAQPGPQVPDAAPVLSMREQIIVDNYRRRVDQAATHAQLVAMVENMEQHGLLERQTQRDPDGTQREVLAPVQGQEALGRELLAAINARDGHLRAEQRSAAVEDWFERADTALNYRDLNTIMAEAEAAGYFTRQRVARDGQVIEQLVPVDGPNQLTAQQLQQQMSRAQQRLSGEARNDYNEAKALNDARNKAEWDNSAPERLRVRYEEGESPWRVADVEQAHNEALGHDRSALAQYQVREEFRQQIEDRVYELGMLIAQRRAEHDRAAWGVRDSNVRQELEKRRDRDVAELERQGQFVTEELEKARDAKSERVRREENRIARQVALALEHARHSRTSRYSLSIPIRALDDTEAEQEFEDRAWSERATLGAEPEPYRIRRRGGWLRGPRVVEQFYRVRGGGDNNHMVIVARRRRRTGELLSQQLLTSSEPVQGTARVERRLPRDIRRELEAAQDEDRVRLRGHLIWRDYIGGVNLFSRAAERYRQERAIIESDVQQRIDQGPGHVEVMEGRARFNAEQNQLQWAERYRQRARRNQQTPLSTPPVYESDNLPTQVRKRVLRGGERFLNEARAAGNRFMGLLSGTVGRRLASNQAAREVRQRNRR